MHARGTRRKFFQLETLEARETPSAGTLKIDPTQFASDKVIVQMKNNAVPRSPLIRSAESLGGGMYLATLRPVFSADGGLRSMKSLRGVHLAEPDYKVTVDAIPNDPSFSSLYGLNNTGQSGGTLDADIDAPEAWDINTGSGNTVVAVIDTGVNYNHPDLAANMWRNPGETAGDSVDNDGNGLVDDIFGADYANNDGNPMDDNGHGTHVAGTIGAVGNNGIGVAGVNWNVKIMALKFMTSNGSGSISNAIKCLNYAVAKGAKISNNSWGGGGYSSAMNTAIDNARNNGHIFVAAAGNGGSDGVGDNNDATPNYPSNYPQDNILAVAATSRTDALGSFSNYGATTVDLAAPGVSIYSTYGSSYATLSGTSMAAPQVAGAAALVWDAKPNWTYSEVIAALKNTVDPKANLAGKVATGGRLNVDAAIRYGGTPADTAGPRVTGAVWNTANGSVSSVRLTFNEAIGSGTFTTDDAALTGPGGSIGVSAVNSVSPTQFDVTFAAQNVPGTYSLTVGPNIADSAGNLMNQNNAAPNGENPADRFTTQTTLSSTQTFNSSDVNKTVVDNAQTVSILNVGASATITDINVKFNVAHTYDSDLKFTLVAPDGTSVLLVNRRGGSANNFTNTTINDEASLGINQGSAPFSSSYRPESSLTAFDGKNVQGQWKLVIDDVALYDSGYLYSWSITINS